MQIRTRLTIQFVLIVAFILFMGSLAIYLFSAGHRKEDFYERLLNKASNTAMLLIQFEEVDLGLLKKMEAENPVSLPKEKVIIFDYKNEIIYSTDENKAIDIAQEQLDLIRLEGNIRFKSKEFEALGFLYTGEYDRFVVIIGGVDIFGWRKLHNLRNILLIVISLSLLLSLVLGWIYSGRALSPISSIIKQVDEISAANLGKRLATGNQKDEITRLSATFNKMLDRLEIAFNSQKQFINNASHELRTPLTAITGQLEVVLMSDRQNIEYKQTISSVLEDIKGLNNISNRLLLLAQANAAFTEVNITAFRMDELVWQCREYLMKRQNEYQIIIRFSGKVDDENMLFMKGDINLIRTLVINLMENGCKYSPDHRVEVIIEPDEENLTIHFENQGIGIAAEEIGQIFEPFRRGKNALGIKGHGIGLSLVERIATLHHGKITVKSQLNQRTVFTLSLPHDTLNF